MVLTNNPQKSGDDFKYGNNCPCQQETNLFQMWYAVLLLFANKSLPFKVDHISAYV